MEENKQTLETLDRFNEAFNETVINLIKIFLELEKQQIEEIKKANDPSNGFFGIFKIMRGG